MEPELPTPPNHILRNNLLGVLAAAVVLGAFAKATQGGIAIVFAAGYVVQVGINLIMGVVSLVNVKPGRSAAPYFLSALLVLLIGFGACGLMVVSNLGNMH